VARHVDYDDDEPYVGNRPVVDLILHGPGGPKGATTAPVAVALVDTGADYGQLDLNLALYVGLDPVNQGVPVTVATAGGLVALHELVVDLEFLGQTLPVAVHFASGAAPLLGRQGLFQAVQAAGFETTEWLQQWYPTAPAATQSNDLEADVPETTQEKTASVRPRGPYPRVTWDEEGKGTITWSHP
jgi:predicted aspartyl protease